MKKIYCLILLLVVASLDVFAIDSLKAIRPYMKKLKELVEERDYQINNAPKDYTADGYTMYLILPPTLYAKTLMQQFSAETDTAVTDEKVAMLQSLNNAFARLYVQRPDLITQTENQIQNAGTIREDMDVVLSSDDKLTSKIVASDLNPDLGLEDFVEVRKPRFWNFSGDGSLQFTQAYFSDNWYQGGEGNYAALFLLNLKLVYDDKRKNVWENLLETQLGFQTSPSDKEHSFFPTSNLIRFNTKFGRKAYKTLYYSGQVILSTQLVPKYKSNTNDIETNFLDPLDLNISVGIDWKFQTKHFTGSVYLAPVAYNMRYVEDTNLAHSRYGIDEGENFLHKWGPYTDIKTSLKLGSNFTWDSRIRFFSDFKYINTEWENTITFTINRYITTKLFLYPRFDDSSEKFHDDKMGYFMFKEWLSLGLSYKW